MKSTSGITAVGSLSVLGHFPPRPGHGTMGKPIVVYANYFQINTEPNLMLTRYNVEVSPEAKGRKLVRIFELLLELPQFKFVVTEWKSMIVSKTLLDIPDGYTVDIVYRADGEDEPLEKAQIYKVRVVTPTTLAVGEYTNYLSATSTGGPAFLTGLEIIQGLNAVLGHQPKANEGVVSIGQNRHFSIDRTPQNAHNIKVLGQGLESLRGYYQSIRPASGGILLNVNVTHGVFFEPTRLSLLFPKCTSSHNPFMNNFYSVTIQC